MGQVLHGSATTTAAIRRAIQHSEESLMRAQAKRYGVNQKTIAKWKKRSSVADRMARLEEFGLIDKRPYRHKPTRHEFHLTRKGADPLSVKQEICRCAARRACGRRRRGFTR